METKGGVVMIMNHDHRYVCVSVSLSLSLYKGEWGCMPFTVLLYLPTKNQFPIITP